MLKNLVRGLLAAAGYSLSRIQNGPREYLQQSLIEEAERAGVHIGDYMELKWGEAGKSRSIVEGLLRPHLNPDSAVLEVGPGTGMYALKILESIDRGTLHLYELDPYWQNFLRKLTQADSRVQIHQANGYSYDEIGDGSIDLYCANGVFEYTDQLVMYRNLMEGVRVTKPGGILAFDFFDSDEQGILEFIRTNMIPEPGAWKMHSRSLVVEFMESLGCRLQSKLPVKYHNFHSLYTLFAKQ